MADNAFVKIGTALLKHQVKKLVGDETLEVIGEELADIGGDKLDAWLGEQSTQEEIEKAARSAQSCFHEKVRDNEIQQWMTSLPLGNLPKVVEAVDELPSSPDESKLENTLRESISLNWKKFSSEQVDNAVNSFLSCLRSAILPIEKQTLMVIGRSVLRTEDKVDLLVRWFEQYIITGRLVEIKQLTPEPNEGWYLAHPYPMPPNFSGRVEERKMLVDWLNKDNENRLFILRALGGFGKSALTWHWLTHDVDSNEWEKVIFWSFYEGDASFEHFIEETLKYLKLEVPQGQRPQVDELLKAMGSQKILLIMDGFERALRAYSGMNAAYQGDEAQAAVPSGEDATSSSGADCVSLNAEIFLKHLCSLPNIKSKVLMTTRLTPRAVKPRGEFMLGCREVELTSMQPADAVEFFRKQGINGTHAEIEAACTPYGYHPLSLRLLAGRILKDFENPADIVVAQKLNIDGDIIQQKHHVLEVSYNSLPTHEQKLLSTIACFRSPVELKTLQSVAENKNRLDYDLQDLRERGLLHFDEKNKKFDLHPIVRRYAYERLTVPDRIAIHNRLRQYFAFVARAISTQPKSIIELTPLIELYYHSVQTGQLDWSCDFYYKQIWDSIYYRFNAYYLQIELLNLLFPDGRNNLPRLQKVNDQVWTYNELANAHGGIGQPQDAIEALNHAVELATKIGNRQNLAINLNNLSDQQMTIGKFLLSDQNLRHCIVLCKQINEIYDEVTAHASLGKLFSYRGTWRDAEFELGNAMSVYDSIGVTKTNSVSTIRADRAILEILRGNIKLAQEMAHQALELSQSKMRSQFAGERDIVRAQWLVGSTYLINDKLNLSEQYLIEALNRCRNINMIDHEANILLDLARLRYDQQNYEEAKSLADEALTITERCGYVLQGADVNLFLAQYALEQEKDKAKAKHYAEEALKLATCDGPPYYYKVAYEEAERFLEQLK